jgi:hypothetical protein
MRGQRASGFGPLLIGWAAVLVAAAGWSGEIETPPAGLDAGTVARRAEQSLRGSRTSLVARMTVRAKASATPSEFRLRVWDDRSTDRAFVRARDSDGEVTSALLKLPPNLWSYTEKDEVKRRVPPAEQREGWLEGDFTLDDLVRASDLVDDYHYTLVGVAQAPDGVVGRRAHVIEYLPQRDSPELWGRVVAWIDTEWGTPLRRDYYDAAGQRVRTIRFGDVREVQGRYYPHLWIASAPGSKGRESRIEVEQVDFIADIPGSTFDIENLTPPD